MFFCFENCLSFTLSGILSILLFFFVLFGLLRIVILLSNQHVLLLHYEEAGKQTFESLRMA